MMAEQLDIFETSDQHVRVEMYRLDDGKTIVANKETVSNVELIDILKDWDFHEVVLGSTVYNSTDEYGKKKFMVVTDIES